MRKVSFDIFSGLKLLFNAVIFVILRINVLQLLSPIYKLGNCRKPLFFNYESNLSEAPEGRFSPRSHWLTMPFETFR